MGQVVAREQEINRHLAIVHWYQGWGRDMSPDFSPELLQRVRAHGSTPLITWEPWNGKASENSFPLSAIAAGAFDAYVDSWAVGLRSYGHPALLSFAHEMQGGWYPWGAGVHGNTPRDYVAAYRHVHDRFTQAGASNVQWVWTVAADAPGSLPPAAGFYPGDRYIDWLGADVYNFGTTQTWSSWQSLSSLFTPAYARLTALHATAPVMLAEWGSVETGGAKGAWIQDAARSIPGQFSRVRAAVWFGAAGSPYPLNTSGATLAAARAAFGAPFCATLPY
jgi:beta-mannanase